MQKYCVIIPVDMRPQPDKYERIVARLCAEKFQSDILFVKRSISTTPDIFALKSKQFWEIKNIQGNGKNTIEDNLKRARKNLRRVILVTKDLRIIDFEI